MAFIGTPLDTRNTFQSLVGKRFSGDGSTTGFTLDVAPGSVLDIEVFVGNVRQDPNSAYTISGTTLTFTGAPPSGTNNIYVVHQAKSVGTIDVPALGVSTASIQADAITEAKIADDAVESEHLNNNIISGQTELAATPADTDEFLISDAGTLKRIDFSHIKPTNITGASAYPDGTQSMADNTFTKVDLETERYDDNSEFASSRFTAAADGRYLVSASVFENGEAGSNVQHFASIYKNGSRFLDGGQTTDYGVNYTFHVPTTAIALSSGDYLELYYFHNKGSALTINGLSGSIQTTHLTVLKIG